MEFLSTILTDKFIMNTVDLLKSDYSIVTGFVIAILGLLGKKYKWINKTLVWFGLKKDVTAEE